MKTRALLPLLLLCAALPLRAQTLQPVPALETRVTDLTGTLTAGQQSELEQKLAAVEQRKGTQIAVLLVPTTQPEAIEQFAIRVVDAWKLGRAKPDDGVLLLVALTDRAIRIEVGYGLEGAITDALSSRIINNTITPLFRQGNIFGGVSAGVDEIIRVVDGEALPPPDRSWQAPADRLPGLLPFLFFGVVGVGAFLRAVFGRALGAMLTGGATGAVVWFISKVLGFAIGAGVVALIISLMAGLASTGPRHRARWPPRRRLGWRPGWRRLWRWRFRGRRRWIPRRRWRLRWRRRLGEMVMLRRVLRHLFTPQWIVRRYFPPALMEEIQRRIADVERRHPGEIRFVVEHALEPGDLVTGLTPRERALEVFGLLRVWDTEHNNGVLVYVLHAEHAVEIVADRGLARRVEQAEWDALCRQVETHFRAGRFREGSMAAIDGAGQLLEQHFSHRRSGSNELPDQPLLL